MSAEPSSLWHSPLSKSPLLRRALTLLQYPILPTTPSVVSSQKEVILTMHTVTCICTGDHMSFSPVGASTYMHCAKNVVHACVYYTKGSVYVEYPPGIFQESPGDNNSLCVFSKYHEYAHRNELCYTSKSSSLTAKCTFMCNYCTPRSPPSAH